MCYFWLMEVFLKKTSFDLLLCDLDLWICFLQKPGISEARKYCLRHGCTPLKIDMELKNHLFEEGKLFSIHLHF